MLNKLSDMFLIRLSTLYCTSVYTEFSDCNYAVCTKN